jgi:hypothetical protein
MTLAAVWKFKQSENGPRLPNTQGQLRELTAIDAAIQTLEFCGHRNPFARRYLILIKDLRRQLASVQLSVDSPSSRPSMSSTVSSVSTVTLSDTVAEGLNIQDMTPSIEQSGPMFGMPRSSFGGRGSYSSASPLDMNMDNWPPRQFGTMYQDDGESTYGESSPFICRLDPCFDTNLYADSMSSMLINPDEQNFWNEMRE